VHANAISQPHALVMLLAQVPMGIANGCGSTLSGSGRSLRLYVTNIYRKVFETASSAYCETLHCPNSSAAKVLGGFASAVAPVAG
jgi:hypothetical protein